MKQMKQQQHETDSSLFWNFGIVNCVRDIIAVVFKFYPLFAHSFVAQLVADTLPNPENGLILSDHSESAVLWIRLSVSD